jgi:CheY-like chemotaxis protein
MKTVLFVDDDDVTRTMCEVVLSPSERSSSFDVKFCTNGEEAMAVLRSTPIDLVLTDIYMPQMDGFQLMSEVMMTYPWIEVMAMTERSTSLVEQKLKNLQTFKCLKKPLDLHILPKLIERHLGLQACGDVSGISLVNLLRVFHLERTSCLVRVSSPHGVGKVYLLRGELVHAEWNTLKGHAALSAVVGWERPRIEFEAIETVPEESLSEPFERIFHQLSQNIVQMFPKALWHGASGSSTNGTVPVGARPEGHWARLNQLANKGATGEIIITNSDLEAHIHLIGGNIAWATSSNATQKFTHVLVEQGVIAEEELQEVLKECWSSRQNIMTTLMEWGLVAEEELREALGIQFAEVLEELRNNQKSENIFLERSQSSTSNLVFGLSDLIHDEKVNENSLVTTKKTIPPPAHKSTPNFEAHKAQEMLQRFTEAGIRPYWVAIVEKDGTSSSAGIGTISEPTALTDHARKGKTHKDWDLCVLKTVNGAVLGQHSKLTEQRVWCAVNQAEFSLANLVLARLFSAAWYPKEESQDTQEEPLKNGIESVRQPGVLRRLLAERKAIERIVVWKDANQFSTAAEQDVQPLTTRENVLIENCIGMMSQPIQRWLPKTKNDAELGMVSDQRAIAYRFEDSWWYGCNLLPHRDYYLLLQFQRTMPQGFGWVILNEMQEIIRNELTQAE